MSARGEIEAAIPHRDPFLFVDRVVERGEAGLLAEWTVPPDADWFRGHYPGRPILPGVLLCEHVFQCAALFVAGKLGAEAGMPSAQGAPVLTKIDGARFRRIVAPGDTLRTRVEVREVVGPAWYMSGRVQRGEERVLDVRFVVTHSAELERLKEAMG